MSIMTAKEARDILGDDADSLTDLQIEDLVRELSIIAEWALKDAIERNKKQLSETQ